MSDIIEKSLTARNIYTCQEILLALTRDPKWTGDVLGILQRREPDIRPLLCYLAETMQPERYLEIGVRRGFSMAMVAAQQPICDIYGFDLWVANYGDVANPGPEYIVKEMGKVDYEGTLTLVSGDSRQTLPRFFVDNPGLKFPLILVDGDHSYDGAISDLRYCLPRLETGGYLLIDDLDDPAVAGAWGDIMREFGGYDYHTAGRVGLIHNLGAMVTEFDMADLYSRQPVGGA